jgi:hypothetical protein
VAYADTSATVFPCQLLAAIGSQLSTYWIAAIEGGDLYNYEVSFSLLFRSR